MKLDGQIVFTVFATLLAFVSLALVFMFWAVGFLFKITRMSNEMFDERFEDED